MSHQPSNPPQPQGEPFTAQQIQAKFHEEQRIKQQLAEQRGQIDRGSAVEASYGKVNRVASNELFEVSQRAAADAYDKMIEAHNELANLVFELRTIDPLSERFLKASDAALNVHRVYLERSLVFLHSVGVAE